MFILSDPSAGLLRAISGYVPDPVVKEELVELEEPDVCVWLLVELLLDESNEEDEGEVDAELAVLELEAVILLLDRPCDVDLFEPFVRTKKAAAPRMSTTIRTAMIARPTAARLSSFIDGLFEEFYATPSHNPQTEFDTIPGC